MLWSPMPDSSPTPPPSAAPTGATEPATRDRDRALLCRWAEGDASAGTELLAAYRGLCTRLSQRLGVRGDDAVLDVHQELAVRLVENARHLPERVKKSFAGYVAWQVRDIVKQTVRRRRRDVQPVHLDPSARPDRDLDAFDAIEHCAALLTARELEVFDLRYKSGLSLKAVAAQLGSNENAVAQAIFRLSRKMRDCLAAQGYDQEVNRP